MGSLYYSTIKKNTDTSMNECNRHSDDHPISVNCAGRLVTEFSFTTDNPQGRSDYYLLYVVRGEMDLRVGELKTRARSGSIFLIPPHAHYTYTYSEGEPLEYLWAHFTGSYAEGFLRDCGIYPLPFFGLSRDSGIISEGFRRMFEEFERRPPLVDRRTAVCLQEIILDVAESVSRTEARLPIEASLRYIHSSYDSHLSIPELAAMENLSNSRYIALFNKYMGMPPSAYIIKLRMDAARELLQTTDMSIKRIGMLVGYPDAHFFSKLFKKHVGLPPAEFREKN